MLQHLEIIPSAEPRADLIRWLNDLLPDVAPNGQVTTPVRKVEQCGNCMAYCLLLPDMLPIRCPPLLTRVKVPANHEFEAVANLKLMKDALARNGIPRPELLEDSADKLVRGNFQANLQLLQWFRGLHAALLEADIEAGQGRVQLDPDRSSLNSSCLSGPVPENTHGLRRLTQHQPPSPLAERVQAVNQVGDHSAAAAAALIDEARSASASPSIDRRRGSLDRNGPATPAARTPGRRGAAAPARPRVPLSPAASSTTPHTHGGKKAAAAGGGGRATPARRGTPARPSSASTRSSARAGRAPSAAAGGGNGAAAAHTRSPKTGSLAGSRTPHNSSSSGPRRPSPAPRAPTPTGTQRRKAAPSTGATRKAAAPPPSQQQQQQHVDPVSVSASSSMRAAPATVSVHHPPARPASHKSNGNGNSTSAGSASLNNTAATTTNGGAGSIKDFELARSLRETEAAQEQLKVAQRERQFYYDKLRMIESLVAAQAGGREGKGAADAASTRLARSIRDILYAAS